MSKALYRTYRSTSLDEVVGQSHVTDILKRSLASGKIAHAYLLTGPRGVGKTSIARILAFEINKLPYSENTTNLDIIEIDAASNNGVENIRDLIEKVQIAPVAALKKVYIIDEVHMLSKSAFNALLKTLEEPPEHAVFILATTDVNKLPPTIISRTQHFSFRSITPAAAASHLRMIADKEKIKIDDDALNLIAERGAGSFRDSISLLDQLQSITAEDTLITRELIEQSLGLAHRELIDSILQSYEKRDLKGIVDTLDASEQQGIQPSVLAGQLIAEVRARLLDTPQLMTLLDQLLDVERSPQPSIKLLTTLASHCVPRMKSAALQVAAPAVSAPVRELAEIATQEKPHLPAPQAPVVKQQSIKQRPSTPAPKPTAAPAQTPDAAVQTSIEKSDTGIELKWDELIEYTRANYVAIYSVLKKCHHTQDGNAITLYTGTAFWKKKLDDPRHRLNLLTAMESIGAVNLLVETVGTPPPPTDSTAASVAAIMGGGEEVSVDV